MSEKGARLVDVFGTTSSRTNQSSKAGFFITFEGGDGSGKTTQAALLKDALQKMGIKVCCTLEPGGSSLGNEIRKIVKTPDINACQSSLVMLFMAARAQHIHSKINPELEGGSIVICDRYNDSTRAYQDETCDDAIMTIFRLIPNAPTPDVTFLIDLGIDHGLARARERSVLDNELDRFESQDKKFHEKVREKYLKIARDNQDRFIVIDGERDVDVIHREILEISLERLAKSNRRLALMDEGFGKVVLADDRKYSVIRL
jgi:dTMP kinase